MSRRRNCRGGSLASRAARRLRCPAAASVQVPALLISAVLAPQAAPTPAATAVPSRILCSGYQACARQGYSSYGYPRHARISYWRMFAGNECTNYAAYVEATVYRAPAPQYLLGNAGSWAATAAAHGVRVNHVPSVGAVAEWDGGAYGVGPDGHVAVVEKVGPRNRYILISQQNISSDANGYDWTRINAGYPADSWEEWPSHFIHFRIRTRDTVGYYDRRHGTFALRDSLSFGPAAVTFRLGPRGMVPLAGDWTGNGRDSVGYYNPRNGSFHLRTTAGRRAASYSFTFGPPGMIPIAGNWTGRRRDSVGYYNRRTARFTLRVGRGARPGGQSFAFGPPGMIPVVGSWNGGTRSEVGYYNRRTGTFVLRNGLARGRTGYAFRFGPGGMRPLAGDWLG
jgi:surface antigen